MEFHAIKTVKPLKDMILEVEFNNGIGISDGISDGSLFQIKYKNKL